MPCLHRARRILEPASVLRRGRRGLSAAFHVICNILSRVSGANSQKNTNRVDEADEVDELIYSIFFKNCLQTKLLATLATLTPPATPTCQSPSHQVPL